MSRVVWEMDPRLFLQGWGCLPEMVMTVRHRRADPQPVPPWEWRKRNR